MRLIVATAEPVEEIAAQPATLDRLRRLLQLPDARQPGLGLPLVADPTIPPLTVHLRPATTRTDPT